MNSTSKPNKPILIDETTNDWQDKLAALTYAYGRPDVLGLIKVSPQDFKVTELMEVEPSGEGEHYWLDISKTRQNTDQVAKALARFSGVAYRDVGYSGLKDFHAVTRQWFSVWRPKGELLKWSEFEMENIEVHSVHKHSRKIKRSTHKANQFEIVVRDLIFDHSKDQTEEIETSLEEGLTNQLTKSLTKRLTMINQRGVPNYFGEQRFGRGAGNMNQAYDMLVNDKRIKARNLRGLLLSSARSWLFNTIVSERVSAGTWEQLQYNEPANLNGSNSNFISDGSTEQLTQLQSRLSDLDIHPTAPMWGDRADQFMSQSESLHHWERTILKRYEPLCNGLENARVEYQRRGLRIAVQNLQWTLSGRELSLRFSLPPGQFATSVLREIVLPNTTTNTIITTNTLTN